MFPYDFRKKIVYKKKCRYVIDINLLLVQTVECCFELAVERRPEELVPWNTATHISCYGVEDCFDLNHNVRDLVSLANISQSLLEAQHSYN